ncbi:hypothetical protein Leryth_022215 [Lithospermum erythrorhizon]|nr:hypothetical protein Leryth_022215 [Lithospermum erythrorhizon]
MLEELSLSSIVISSNVPRNLSSSLVIINLSDTKLKGQPPDEIFHLPNLQKLSLSNNDDLGGHLPNMRWNSSTSLQELDLSFTRFSGELPASIGHLRLLNSLDLSNCKFMGSLPQTIGNFQNLKLLFLGDNSFNGTIPSSFFSFPSLKYLGLGSNQLEGHIHEFQYHSFEYIDLSGNKLHGPLPNSLSKLVNLTTLDLSSNNLDGNLDVETLSIFKDLRNLRLSFNNISLIAKNATLPESIGRLALASCNIRELDFLRTTKFVGFLDLSWNNIQGEIPEWVWSNWQNSVFYLNLSHNLITQTTKQPLYKIVYFDLRSNNIQGPLPIPPLSTLFFFISNNQISGTIPPSICKLKSLRILDISNNRLNGSIPKCVGTMSKELTVLDMHMNNLQGTIPSIFKIGNQLRALNLRGNKLEGDVPRSLKKCRELEVLDLSNNDLNDTFPIWLEVLPKLLVLSLRSNNLYGPVRTSDVDSSFSKLQMIDISHNRLSGNLPETFFKSFKSMSLAGKPNRSVNYIGDNFYKDTVVVITKGTEIKLERILSVFTTMDLSSNKFEGNITDSIGDLVSLRQLNLSHNSFSGQIPVSVSNLSVLESLDLSSNQLIGTIPEHLTALNSLSVMNLSWNHLVGRIPSGSQFQTFQNDSYIGNDGLCGFPMSKMCAGDKEKMQPSPNVAQQEDHSEFFDGLTWKSLLFGYGIGTVFGLVIGIVMFLVEKPFWLIKVVEQIAHKMFKNEIRNEGYMHW